jgi:hypothetical protein
LSSRARSSCWLAWYGHTDSQGKFPGRDMLGSDPIGTPNQSGPLDPSISLFYLCDRSLAGTARKRCLRRRTTPHQKRRTGHCAPIERSPSIAWPILAHTVAQKHTNAYMAPTSSSNTISTYSLYSTLMVSLKCLTLSNLACYLGCFLSSSFCITSNSVGAYSN